MGLSYNILWVDDRKKDIEDVWKENEKLYDYIKNELYFYPTIDLFATSEEALKTINNKRYDIILTDYNLMDNEYGTDFIKKVRGSNIQSEVLFYSANNNIKEITNSLIASTSETETIDRMSFCKLPIRRKEEFIEILKNFVNSSVEKFNTLSVVRSIVISETSDLDNKMIDIIKQYYSVDFDSKKDSFMTNVISGKEKDLKGKLTCKHDNKSCTYIWRDGKKIDKIINDFNFGSRMIAKTISLIMEETGFAYESDYVDDYKISDKRNDFAHCSAEYKDGKEVLFNPRSKKFIYFDKNKISDIRKSIMRFNEVLDNLSDFLKSKKLI